MSVWDKNINCRMFKDARKYAVVSEKKKYYRIQNQSLKTIANWRVDGCLIKNETACDYLFLIGNEKEEAVYWVELKGSDIEYAAMQILNTIPKFELGSEVVQNARIIPSRNPNPKFRGAAYRKLESYIRSKKGTVINKNLFFEETI